MEFAGSESQNLPPKEASGKWCSQVFTPFTPWCQNVKVPALDNSLISNEIQGAAVMPVLFQRYARRFCPAPKFDVAFVRHRYA